MSDMAMLRIWILVAGVVLVAAIIFFGRPKKPGQGRRVARGGDAGRVGRQARTLVRRKALATPVLTSKQRRDEITCQLQRTGRPNEAHTERGSLGFFLTKRTREHFIIMESARQEGHEQVFEDTVVNTCRLLPARACAGHGLRRHRDNLRA